MMIVASKNVPNLLPTGQTDGTIAPTQYSQLRPRPPGTEAREQYQWSRETDPLAGAIHSRHHMQLRPFFVHFNQCSFNIIHNSPWRPRIALISYSTIDAK